MNHKPAMQLSNKVKDIPEALSVYFNNIVYAMKRRGDEVSVLSLGEAYFNIPMFPFESLDFKKGYHYSESRGYYELRQIISNYYKNNYSAAIDPDTEIIISAGSKPLIYMAFQAILNPNDEVLIHEPAWLSYPEEIKLANGIPKFIPYDCPVEQFCNYFNEKTKIVVLNNPNNPAGRIYCKDELIKLYEECRRRGIYILVDEAYSDFVIDDSFRSMANIVPDKDGIIVVNSLSKNLGISGWRIGYVIAKKEVIYSILKLNQHLITCPSTILLMYVSAYFDKLTSITLPQAKEVVKKREKIAEYCTSIGLTPLPGSATFYLFLNIGNYKYSSLDLAHYLLMKHHIAVVPGSAYGESTERFIRIGVGAENIQHVIESINIIKETIDNNAFDDDYIEKELDKLGIIRFRG